MFLIQSLAQVTQVNLVGGLGNQLFVYIAGKYLEDILGHRVVFNTWHISRGLTDHGVTLEGRGLTGEFICKAPPPQWGRLFQRRFKSRELGWDPNLQMLRRGGVVEGYFQTWRYLQALGADFLSQDQILLGRGRSPWLTQHLEMAADHKPLIVHFRRGDYRKVPEAMGLLDRDYYRKALNTLPGELRGSPIWIFSDEPRLASEFFANFKEEILVIKPPQDSDPGESLFLMAQGHGHIISNSTFAWWGAVLSKNSGLVMAPSPWLRGYKTPRDFLLRDWILLEHEWGSG